MSIERLKHALNSSGEHLGDLVWWFLSDASINRVELESRWKHSQLAADLLPEPPTAEKALKSAVKECSSGHPDRLIRLGYEDETQLTYGIVRESRSLVGLTYVQEAKVSLDKVTQKVATDDPHHNIASSVVAAYAKLRNVQSSDEVRRTLVKTLGSFSAVTLREGGGIYWAPRTSSEPLRRLQGFVEGLGQSKFYLVPVHDSVEGNKALGEVAKNSLETELAELAVEIELFKNEPPARASTLVNRLEAFQEIKDRAELYRTILAVNVADIDTGLNELAVTVEAMLLNSKAA